MIRIAICDDEKNITERLRDIIENHLILIKINQSVTCFHSGEEFLEKEIAFDIVFLDIKMGGKDGIETAKILRERNKKTSIVYVTSFAAYAKRAYAVHPFGYIIKPFKDNDVKQILDDYMLYNSEKQAVTKLEFNTDTGILSIDIKEIYYLECQSRKVRLVTNKGEYRITGRISEYIDILEKYYFCSPHKSFAVNLDNIRQIKDRYLVVENLDEIPISQRKYSEVKSKFNEFLYKKV